MIYLDYAASTPVDPAVIEPMSVAMAAPGNSANPSSTHREGRHSNELIAAAAQKLAALVGTSPDRLIWTSGATESDNLAIFGAAAYRADRGRHLVSMRTEHKAVTDPFARLAKRGFEVTWVDPEPDGRLDLDSRVTGESSSPRYRALTGDAIYGDGLNGGADGEALVDTTRQYGRPGGAERWANFAITPDDASGVPHGADNIAGGAGGDTLFGQGGNDTIQGDGSISLAVSAGRDADGLLVVSPSVENFAGAGNDGDDYIEGNAGDDLIFGNLAQHDIIGGSSSLFGLNGTADGADLIFGGAGTDIARNNSGDTSATGHASDADMILGDNGNIYRLVGTQGVDGGAFLSFTYDNYSVAEHIIVRAAELLDYTPGGMDFDPVNAVNDLGSGDEIHGESGDDFIYGMTGNDMLFGEGQDDDLIGGYGHDWIAGGTGSDGVESLVPNMTRK